MRVHFKVICAMPLFLANLGFVIIYLISPVDMKEQTILM